MTVDAWYVLPAAFAASYSSGVARWPSPFLSVKKTSPPEDFCSGSAAARTERRFAEEATVARAATVVRAATVKADMMLKMWCWCWWACGSALRCDVAVDVDVDENVRKRV